MKKYIKAICLAGALFLTAGAASANPVVDEIVVNQSPAHTPDGTNIRVNVMNDATAAELPAMNVVLYARQTGDTDWVKVKSWNHNLRADAGRKLSYDFFGLADVDTTLPLYSPSYELKAVMEDPSGMAMESSAVYASSTDASLLYDTADVQLLDNGDVIYEDQ
jgi:hypothetical protein